MCTESQQERREDAANILEEMMFSQFLNCHMETVNPQIQKLFNNVNQGKHKEKITGQFKFKMRKSSHKGKS